MRCYVSYASIPCCRPYIPVQFFRSGQGELILRYVVALLVTLVFAACSTTPVSRNQSQATSPRRFFTRRRCTAFTMDENRRLRSLPLHELIRFRWATRDPCPYLVENDPWDKGQTGVQRAIEKTSSCEDEGPGTGEKVLTAAHATPAMSSWRCA